MNDLVKDPRPELSDTLFWRVLFVNTFELERAQETYALHVLLWQMRAMGMMVNRTHQDIKLVPLIHPDGEWESVEWFNEMRDKFLRPRAAEIKELLARVSLIAG
jgi:hypothetical protein